MRRSNCKHQFTQCTLTLKDREDVNIVMRPNVWARYVGPWTKAKELAYEHVSHPSNTKLEPLQVYTDSSQMTWTRVEAPINDHLRGYALNMERYKAVHFSKITYWVSHNCSFLPTLASKPRTCLMTLSVQIWSKYYPNIIEIMASYRFPMGSWLGIGASTVNWFGGFEAIPGVE
jgi:hypothetical protein